MRITILAIALFALNLVSAQSQIITNFGADATNFGSWSYNSGTSTLSGVEGLGDSLFGSPLNSDITGSDSLQLVANATTSPLGSFTIVLEDSGANLASSTFQWSDFNGGATVSSAINFTTFDFGNVVGWTLLSGGSNQALDVELTSIEAIPEPTTGALLGLAGLGLLAARRRK